jgi:multicomponent Na+:H+ antiporter subunit E
MTGAQAYRTLPKLAALSALWLAFSGKFDALHLGFGAVSVALVMRFTRSMALEKTRADPGRPMGRARWRPALAYPFWLLKEVAVANVQLARIILAPRLQIDPVLMSFDARLESSLAKVLLANSITLTPGTFTIDVRGRVFLVHAITEDTASPTALGAMRARVANIFGEDDGSIHVLDVHRPGERPDGER